MTSASTCPKCDAPIADGALYCSSCGVDVTLFHAPDDAGIRATDVVPRVGAQVRETLREATLGDYEILHELGRGGMATVFLAHDISLDRRVAIKVIAPHLFEGEGMAERFKLEARTAAQLSHPHIIPIYAVRETESTLFFVMKHVEGRGLEEIIEKRAPLPIPMVKDVLTKVGEALGYAHARGVVHRDVKPANILIEETGIPIVTDFGIAKVAEGEGLTMTGATMGTPSYMSPEQCEAGVVSGASDQYSLGVVAFQMLTGRLPFEATNPFAVMYKHCHEPLPPLEDFRSDLPPEIVMAVARMLEKNPADRWPSMEAAVQMLASGGTDPRMATVRTQLIALAQDPDAEPAADGPVTPFPAARTPVGASGPAPAHAAAGAESGPPAGRAASSAAAPGRRVGIGIGAALVAVAGTAVLAIARPWEGGDSAMAVPPVEAPPAAAASPRTEGGAEVSTEDGVPSDASIEPSGANAGVGAEGALTSGVADEVPTAGAGVAEPTVASASASGGGTSTSGGASSGTAASVTTVRIQGLPSAMEVGGDAVASAVALDQAGRAMAASGATWSSSDASILRVTSGGRVTALAPGQATVSLSVGGVSTRQGVDVAAPAVGSLTLTPSTLSLRAGDRGTIDLEARDGRGGLLTDPDVEWVSDDPSVARVTGPGQIVAEASGSTTVTAIVDGVRATVSVSVAAQPVSTRAAIDQLVADYARALESGDIAAVRRAYPGITSAQARDLEAALSGMDDLRADLTVQSLDERGDLAIAAVSGTYSFVNAANGRREQPSVSFTATFERSGDGWRLIETR